MKVAIEQKWFSWIWVGASETTYVSTRIQRSSDSAVRNEIRCFHWWKNKYLAKMNLVVLN